MGLSLFYVIILVSFAFLMSVGQLLFKKTAVTVLTSSEAGPANIIEGFIRALQTPWLYSALVVYFFATLTWLYILQRVALSTAYPFTALAMVIVPLLAVFLFGEKLSLQFWIGASLIILGIFIIAK